MTTNLKRNTQKNFLKMEQSSKLLFSSKAVLLFLKKKAKYSFLRLAQDLEEIGKVEQMPELEGKNDYVYYPKEKVTNYAKNEKQSQVQKALQIDRKW